MRLSLSPEFGKLVGVLESSCILEMTFGIFIEPCSVSAKGRACCHAEGLVGPGIETVYPGDVMAGWEKVVSSRSLVVQYLKAGIVSCH